MARQTLATQRSQLLRQRKRALQVLLERLEHFLPGVAHRDREGVRPHGPAKPEARVPSAYVDCVGVCEGLP
eukprot:595689-Lingulodinium_polyedra.AAC.1